MTLMPQNNTIIELEETIPSKTYRLDLVNKRIIGMVDNLEAVQQSVLLILNIERYESEIYNWFYGVELDELIGKQESYVRSQLMRTIRDALLEDDRILDISDFDITTVDNKLNCVFTVVSNIGSFDIRKEISL